MPTSLWLRRSLYALMLGMVPGAACADWSPGVEASVLHDDNVSRAQRRADMVSDFVIAGKGSLGRSFALGPSADLFFALEAGVSRFARFDRASSLSLGLNGGYRRKLGLGLTAPRLLLDAWASREDAVEPVRDADRFGASLALAKRFDERLEASVSLAYDRRRQRRDLPLLQRVSGKPFSLQGRTVATRASYALPGSAALFGGASVRYGDVESSTRRNLQIFTESSAIAADPAIGPDYVAYRLTGARTRAVHAGISFALGRHAAIEATLAVDSTRARAGLEYEGRQVSITYIHRP